MQIQHTTLAGPLASGVIPVECKEERVRRKAISKWLLTLWLSSLSSFEKAEHFEHSQEEQSEGRT
jgi:hypothetical protein